LLFSWDIAFIGIGYRLPFNGISFHSRTSLYSIDRCDIQQDIVILMGYRIHSYRTPLVIQWNIDFHWTIRFISR
jgi:hypothetical protein